MVNIEEIIKEAIKSQNELLLKVKWGIGENKFTEIIFQPYIYGDDNMQYSFVWGRWTHKLIYYKILVEHITEAKKRRISHKALPDACYQYSVGEEHYAVLEGFDNIYGHAARPK